MDANITPTHWLAGQLKLPRSLTEMHAVRTSEALVHISGGQDIRVVGPLGRLVTSKGVRLLLDAASILKKEHRQFELLIVGNGPEQGALESYAAALGPSARARLLEQLSQSQLEEALTHVDILVTPSLGREVFGMVVAENTLRGVCGRGLRPWLLR